MSEAPLSSLVLCSAALHLIAEYRGPTPLIYIFKPLTTALIFLIALTTPHPVSSFYQYLICTGLLLSLAGDIFLMLPADRFVPGLLSFLTAHVCYIAAFFSDAGESVALWRTLPLLIYGAVVYRILAAHLGKLKAPVIVYMVVILTMLWFSWERWAGAGERKSATLAFVGALLFVMSDTVLALERFKAKHYMGQALILSTYYAGQWMIANSVQRV